jgi:signal peptidase I
MRVCPECGEPAGTQPFCASCGKNLIHVERLPSREEWEARRARTVEAPAHADTAAIARPLAGHLGDASMLSGRVRIALVTAVPLAAVIAVVVVALVGGKSVAVSGVTTRIPVTSPSMLPTLPVGGAVRVIIAQGYKPNIGEIVVFHPPAGADPATPVCGNSDEGAAHAAACDEPVPRESPRLTLIQRVVAGPGDRITISGGHVFRNGVREQDSRYTEPCGAAPSCNFPATITIPAGDYFVLGDNRGASDDSRLWGPVPRAYIVGKVVR